MRALFILTAASTLLLAACNKQAEPAQSERSSTEEAIVGHEGITFDKHDHDWGPAPAKNIYASNNLFNQKAPEIIVETWLTEEPKTEGKFVLVDFWATWCGPCRRAIPHLNEIAYVFKDELIVIGLSGDSSADKVRNMKSPVIEYYSGVDTKKRTSAEIGIKGIPHLLLIDPNGKVCWQGFPGGGENKFDSEVVRAIIDAYKDSAK
ncbi:Thiol-disulfide isomerase or thioredoxin [Rubritalea squalenifaciens DSM 18772]|uniref:Thiol-disulfide isomerase or thioredoxin n=1 Tax=Rubritalea squalenifaciens DSM 18772 TaxID=1123071 RepID=A0A1M6AWE2_9BACT|nr:TlpA disulfide reductase family protein [Rubritalea squalenifaciens]SHI40731.1 Thiol-disulfide isomerase or thioredoxin [Rubritalea squalenifaciens DSM 18772]